MSTGIASLFDLAEPVCQFSQFGTVFDQSTFDFSKQQLGLDRRFGVPVRPLVGDGQSEIVERVRRPGQPFTSGGCVARGKAGAAVARVPSVRREDLAAEVAVVRCRRGVASDPGRGRLGP